jgi:hypothetical protein
MTKRYHPLNDDEKFEKWLERDGEWPDPPRITDIDEFLNFSPPPLKGETLSFRSSKLFEELERDLDAWRWYALELEKLLAKLEPL